MHAVIKMRPLAMHLSIPVLAGIASAKMCRCSEMLARLPGAISPAAFHATRTALLLCMGIAGYLISTAQGISQTDRKGCLTLYGMLLAAWLLWDFLVFHFGFFIFGMIWSLITLALGILCTALFYRIRHFAGYLIAPLVIWHGSACVLCITTIRSSY